jgi:hypothetical protein
MPDTITPVVTPVVTPSFDVGRGPPRGILNPYDMIRDASGWIGQNKTILYVVIGVLVLIAILFLYEMFKDYYSMPLRERSFRKSKTNISDTIRQELLHRMKKKKKMF